MSRNDSRPLGGGRSMKPEEMRRLRQIIDRAPVVTNDDPVEDEALNQEVADEVLRQTPTKGVQ